MGCVYFKSKKREPSESTDLIPAEKKEYSWDKRPRLNPKDYTIEDLEDSEAVRLPNTVNGRQFIVQNCKDSKIFILDHCNTVTIDDCINCKIVLGSVTGSVFFRSCENCVVIASCGQFRARDCQAFHAFLCCPSQPAIEACCGVRVGCCLLSYNGLREQLKKAGLSPFNNEWSQVHDFTPVPSEGPNWRTVHASKQVELFSSGEGWNEELHSIEFVLGDSTKSVVPLTSAAIDEGGGNSSFVVILPGEQQAQQAYNLISAIVKEEDSYQLVESRERLLSGEQMRQLLQGPCPLPRISDDGQFLLIGLHFRGQDCLAKCHKEVGHLALTPGWANKLHVSQNSSQAAQQIQLFMCSPGQV